MITPFCELPLMAVKPACDAIISWRQNYFDVKAINVVTSMAEMYMSDKGSTILSISEIVISTQTGNGLASLWRCCEVWESMFSLWLCYGFFYILWYTDQRDLQHMTLSNVSLNIE